MVRTNQFERAYRRWKDRKLTQGEAAAQLEMSERTFRRYVARYREGGKDGLLDRRLGRVSPRRVGEEEVSDVVVLYRDRYPDRNIRHFYEAYREVSRGWTFLQLGEEMSTGGGGGFKGQASWSAPGAEGAQGAGGDDTSGREHAQVGSRGGVGSDSDDDDATGRIYIFVAQEGTWSSFRGVREVLEKEGIFSSFYSDRGSHYWRTPQAGGRVDKENPTQFGRGMRELGVVTIPGYSPEARGRSERMFKTLQGRVPAELAEVGITDMDEANRFLRDKFVPDFNRRFVVAAKEEGTAFVPLLGVGLDHTVFEAPQGPVRTAPSSDNRDTPIGPGRAARRKLRCQYRLEAQVRPAIFWHCDRERLLAYPLK